MVKAFYRQQDLLIYCNTEDVKYHGLVSTKAVICSMQSTKWQPGIFGDVSMPL